MLLCFKTRFVIGWAALLGLAPPLLMPATSAAVSISLVPDRAPSITIGETVNVNVFIVLDAADQAAGISAVTMHLEGGGGLVTVTGSGAGSPFLTATVNISTVFPNANDFVVFSQFGTTVNSAQVFLGSLQLTGAMEGSYDLQARRFGSFPLFTAPGDTTNRYDFTSDETVTITIVPEGFIDVTGSWQVNIDCQIFATATSFLEVEEDIVTGLLTARIPPGQCGTVEVPDGIQEVAACDQNPQPASGRVIGTNFDLPPAPPPPRLSSPPTLRLIRPFTSSLPTAMSLGSSQSSATMERSPNTAPEPQPRSAVSSSIGSWT